MRQSKISLFLCSRDIGGMRKDDGYRGNRTRSGLHDMPVNQLTLGFGVARYVLFLDAPRSLQFWRNNASLRPVGERTSRRSLPSRNLGAGNV